ncbi:methyltransferase domain-containing protein [Pseudomonadota bacterium]
MDKRTNHPAEEALLLARMIRQEGRLLHRMASVYWKLAFHLTRVVEHLPQSLPKDQRQSVLNFGCGNQFYDNAVNSDLFSVHRFLLNRRRPDIYWTGTSDIASLRGHFSDIVCEHVIEHLLPDVVAALFSSLFKVLNRGGKVVVSFPDVQKILKGEPTYGFSSSIVSLNSVTYRHGHAFMYDTDIVAELLRTAGFSNVAVTTLDNAPLQEFLLPGREPESAYVTAEKA